MSRFRITVQGQRFYSRIGVFAQERKVGNEFGLDLWVEYDASRFRSEDLSTGISYADVYEVVKEEMGKERLLLESVCEAIRERLKARWPFIESGCIGIEKLSVPIGGMQGSCRVELYF